MEKSSSGPGERWVRWRGTAGARTASPARPGWFSSSSWWPSWSPPGCYSVCAGAT